MKKIRSRVVFLLIFSLLLSIGAGAAASYGSEWAGYTPTAAVAYRDVPPNHWAYEAIQRVSAQNWFSGYPDGTFRPNGSITRAEAVKVFVTFLGLQVNPVAKTSFYDVDASAWYAPYVEAGKDLFPTRVSVQGMVPFQPEMPVSREDTVYALVNALGFGNNLAVVDESVLNMFTDQNSISTNTRKHFAVALQNSLVSGYPDNTIRARDTLTRAEFAALLYRGTLVGFQDTNTAKISKVTVLPASPAELSVGESVTLSARAVYTDGTNQPYTELQPYDASNNGVIALTGTTVKALKEGTATVQFNDSYLQDTGLVIVVKAPTAAPVLKITDYPDTTESGSVSIRGTVSDANLNTLNLTCNGKDVLVGSDGSFGIEVSLNEGGNTFRFVAANQYGMTAEKSVSITRGSTTVQGDPDRPDKRTDVDASAINMLYKYNGADVCSSVTGVGGQTVTCYTVKAVINSRITKVKVAASLYANLRDGVNLFDQSTIDADGCYASAGLNQTAYSNRLTKDFVDFTKDTEGNLIGNYTSGVIALKDALGSEETYAVDSSLPLYVYNQMTRILVQEDITAFYNTAVKSVTVLFDGNKLLADNAFVPAALYVTVAY